MISYYIITLPPTKEATRITTCVAKGVAKADGINANRIPTTRMSLDGSKALIKAEVTEEMKKWLETNSAYVEYLGDLLETGQAEQKVYDWMEKNKAEWERDEDIMSLR